MKATYGQLIDGKRITLQEFANEVYHRCVGAGVYPTTQASAKLYNKGYSVEDAVSYLITKS